MPIASGAIGRPGILAIPGRGPRGRHVFRSPKLDTRNPRVAGYTIDSDGAILGSCVVKLFRTSDDLLIDTATSDSNGYYTLCATVGGPFYVIAYKAGNPDVSGTTVNSLAAS